MKIKFIGNKLAELKEIYEEIITKKLEGHWREGFYHYNLRIFGKTIGDSMYNSSYFQRDDANIVSHWHQDVVGPYVDQKEIAIAAYPYPTLFLKCSKKSVKEFSEEVDFRSFGFNYEAKIAKIQFGNQFVEDLLKEGKAEVIEPNPGDIYVISANIIHRANPKSEAPHMVMRATYKKERRNGSRKLRRSLTKTAS
jgi:hypothetical protein